MDKIILELQTWIAFFQIIGTAIFIIRIITLSVMAISDEEGGYNYKRQFIYYILAVIILNTAPSIVNLVYNLIK